MAHITPNLDPTANVLTGPRAWSLFRAGILTAVVSLTLAVLYAAVTADGYTRFFFAYITNFAFYLSLSLGCLFFVLIQHITKAGWSVSIRRVAENIAAAMPWLAVAFAPIFLCVVMGNGDVYRWLGSDHAHDDGQDKHAALVAPVAGIETFPVAADDSSAEKSDKYVAIDPHTEQYYVKKKQAYLNPVAFLIRWAIYFTIWIGAAMFFWRTSLRQDRTGDAALTERMQTFAPPITYLFALSVTFASFDLLMSLSPAWYSTIFGVYYFTGGMAGGLALIIIVLKLLQKQGYLKGCVNREHYHDLGKYLFGFVFFWGYIAFSQYMLIWYANLPETTFWFELRGASTLAPNSWSYVAVLLLFGHFLIPFVGLLSRHVKRRHSVLLFWAVWVLVFHWVDLYWLVLPEMGLGVRFGLPEVLTFLGIGSLLLAGVVRMNGNEQLLARRDPRLQEALAFHNA